MKPNFRLGTPANARIYQRSDVAKGRGMVIVTVMLVLMMIMAVMLIGIVTGSGASARDSGGLVSATNTGLGAVRTRMRVLGAINLADSGTEVAIQWLRQQPSPPTNTSAFAPSSMWNATYSNNYAVISYGGGEFRIRMYPFASNTGPSLKSYLVESVGVYMGATQIVRSVVIQDTFAKYAFFTDNASDFWWVGGNTRFNGPVHINASNGKQINVLWRSGGSTGNRIFTYNGTDAFSTSAASINWNRNSVNPPSTQVAPTSTTDWRGVAAGGSASVRTNVTPVPLPTASTSQKMAALGPTTAEPTVADAPAVIIPNSGSACNGGIYIHGDVDNMVLSASSGANSGSWFTKQRFVITQSDTTNSKEIRWTVESDPTNSTTTLKKETRTLGSTGSWTNDGTTSYSGNPNGVVYSSGNIGKQGDATTPKSGGVSGSVADSWMDNPPEGNTLYQNKWNIVTEASKNININGNLTYAPGTTASRSPILGLVGNRIQIIDKTASGSNIGNINVHAAIVAFDTFDVTNPATRAKATFTLTGGYIAKNAGQFGTFDSQSGALVAGYSRTLNYDRRMAETPPPYFPSTSNQYLVQSSQRVNATLQ